MYMGLVIVPLVTPIVVLEGRSGFQSLRRSWDLVRRRFWWVIGFVLTLTLLVQVVVVGPAALAGILLVPLIGPDIGDQALVTTIIQSLTQLFFSLLLIPLQTTAITLVYFDLRVRTEGFDLTLLAHEGLEGETDIRDIVAQAPPPSKEAIITGTEVGYLVLLTIAAVALYFIIIGVVMAFMTILFSSMGSSF